MMYWPDVMDRATDVFDAMNDWEPFDLFRSEFGAGNTMNTDIKENKDNYEVAVDLPGMKKENINVSLKDGYLTVTASRKDDNDEKNSEGKYIRREHYEGSTSRSFFVGKDMKQEDIHAKYENGVLTLTVPKNYQQVVDDKNSRIMIEG